MGKKSALILDMCITLKAHCYVFGANGKDYADIEQFKAHNVSPYFQSYVHPVYGQIHGEFVSKVGICDLLFNQGQHALDIVMSGNTNKTALMRECNLG
jgi:hypothetical protein